MPTFYLPDAEVFSLYVLVTLLGILVIPARQKHT